MAAEYELLLQSSAGVPLGTLGAGVKAGRLSGVARCTYARGQNVGGEMSLTVTPDVYDPSLFQQFGRVLVQRTIGGTQPYIDLNVPWFILNGPYYALDSNGLATVRFECVDPLGLILPSRVIPYNEYTSYTQKVDFADDMLKELMSENAGAAATDTARSLASFLSIQPDTSQAPSIFMEGLSQRVLLDAMTDIANASANDDTPTWLGFDIVLSDQLTGLLEFRTYIGQRGVDHRFPSGNPPLLLSVEAGNLQNVETSVQYKESASFVYARGAGIGTIAAVATAQDDALIALSPFGRREKIVDGSSIVGADALDFLARSELRNARPRQYMQANLVEGGATPTLRGVQWDFGDYCTANYQGLTFDVRVDKLAVTLDAAPGGGLVDSSQVYLRGEQNVTI